ncbi:MULTISPECIES: DNA alkylation repair protein [unclassified Bacillus (in: firmicutes)]|uniref:DNA alkylation repair protein n=1 Tax=unclassified Bacillus (in: firmicutes) TaxID=185979 RepID=UPI0008F3223C|nr:MULTISPECIES: DNA alkylation repair protein [unclassified Bacillus (in: firmicutes)]SFB03079.1 3-methyladenine DNA glycosylase AlkD [Bacillus sp. UNCCL13]SFQ88886.1 3-methyladenine DNA glycosylase AlkD [Bacillus sp. cl95]
MNTYISKLTSLFEENRNPELAIPMQNYMKNHFDFLGIKSPTRKELEKQFFQETGILKEPFQPSFIQQLWEKEEREYQYTALAYIEKSLKKLTADDLLLMEKLIITKSWWDTVDALAAKPVGKIAEKYPDVIESTIEPWAEHEDMWLRRTAILFQLKFKGKTDEERLYRIILKNNESKEFFIQKAIGWVLREYSKTNPQSVGTFIKNHQLAPLSVREGSKYID